MKSIKISLSVILLFCTVTLTIVSCSKDSEVRYSCNNENNDKAMTMLAINQSISRADLVVEPDLDYQFAIFRSLTSDNKVRIFQEKIAEEIATSLLLNDGEKALLQDLIDLLEPSFYEDGSDEFESVQGVVDVINTLISTHGWDEYKIYAFTNTWLLESELKDITVANQGGDLTPDCICRYDVSCPSFSQGSFFGDCKAALTCKTSGGCGVFGTSSCLGRCVDGGINSSS